MELLVWLLVIVGVIAVLGIAFALYRRSQRRGDVLASGPISRKGS